MYLQIVHGQESLIVLQAQGDEIQICGRESHSRRQSNPRDRVKPCQAVSAQALLQQHRNLASIRVNKSWRSWRSWIEWNWMKVCKLLKEFYNLIAHGAVRLQYSDMLHGGSGKLILLKHIGWEGIQCIAGSLAKTALVVQQVHMLIFQFPEADDCIADVVNVCCAEWIYSAFSLPFAH